MGGYMGPQTVPKQCQNLMYIICIAFLPIPLVSDTAQNDRINQDTTAEQPRYTTFGHVTHIFLLSLPPLTLFIRLILPKPHTTLKGVADEFDQPKEKKNFKKKHRFFFSQQK